MEKSGTKMVIKAEPQHHGDSNSSSAGATHQVTVTVDPADRSHVVFVLPKISPPPATVTISFAGHGSEVEEKEICNDKIPMHDGESNSAVQPVHLHHGMPPADSYIFVLPKNSPPLSSITITFAGHDGREKKDTCKDKNLMGPIVRMGPCGGSGGGAWEMNLAGVNRIVRVNVHHGHAVDAMSVLYERNGLEEWTERWGGDGGRSSEIRLRADEYFTSVRGHVGEFEGWVVLRSLTFVSNLRSFGPYGLEKGMPFTLPADGGKILGFHGRNGIYLDALGTYVKMD